MAKQRRLVVTQTPMRITLAGGGTDVLWYSQVYGGEWISATIDKYVYVVCSKNADTNFIRSMDIDRFSEAESAEKIVNQIIREALDITNLGPGLEIFISSDVKSKSGLGGSGSFEVGLLHALHQVRGDLIKPRVLAEEACDIEINRMRRPIGPQDQYCAAFGGIRQYSITRNGTVKHHILPLSKKVIRSLQQNLLFFKTPLYHDTGKIFADAKKQSEKKQSNHNPIQMLHEIKEIGKRAKKNLLAGNLDEYGKTLHEHWMTKKRLSDAISNPAIDHWYNLGVQNGAAGGKIMGAGGGGWFMFYVGNEHKNAVRTALQQEGLMEHPLNFTDQGSIVLLSS